MATWPRHWLLSFGGLFYLEDEWQCSLRFRWPTSVTTEPTDAEMIAFAESGIADVATDLGTWWAASQTGGSRVAQLDHCKLNAIGSDGHYLDPIHTTQHEYLPAVVPAAFPGATGNTLPQIALALSLTTGAARGPAAHGRIYMPSQIFVMSGYRIDPTPLGLVLSQFHTLITALNDWPGVDPPWAPVVSVVGQSRGGHARAVTGIRVGDIYDSQRTRRGKLTENYVAQTL